MIPFKLPNAAGSTITVTSTATFLYSLIETAASSVLNPKTGLNSILFKVEDGDIRVLFDGNTPTSTEGILIEEGSFVSFSGVALSKMKLIRVGGTDVNVSIQIGFTDSFGGVSFSSSGSDAGGSTTFIGLTDVPGSFVANAILRSNSTATALDFSGVLIDDTDNITGAESITMAQSKKIFFGSSYIWKNTSFNRMEFVSDGTDTIWVRPPDNTVAAVVWQTTGAFNLLSYSTTTGGASMTWGNSTNPPSVSVFIRDNVGEAFTLHVGIVDYFVIETTDGSERILLSPPTGGIIDINTAKADPASNFSSFDADFTLTNTGTNAREVTGYDFTVTHADAFNQTGAIAGFKIVAQSTGGATDTSLNASTSTITLSGNSNATYGANILATVNVATGSTLSNYFTLYAQNKVGSGTITNQYLFAYDSQYITGDGLKIVQSPTGTPLAKYLFASNISTGLGSDNDIVIQPGSNDKLDLNQSTANVGAGYIGFDHDITVVNTGNNANQHAGYDVRVTHSSNDNLTNSSFENYAGYFAYVKSGTGTDSALLASRHNLINSHASGVISIGIGAAIAYENAGTITEYYSILAAGKTSGAGTTTTSIFAGIADEFISNSRAIRISNFNPGSPTSYYIPRSTVDTGITFASSDLTFATTTSGNINLNSVASIILNGAIIQDKTTTSTGAGAVSITGYIHEITTTGIGDALSLANGTEGQTLSIVYVAEGAGTDTAVLTPTSMAGGTTVTFSVIGQKANGLFTAGKWFFDVQGAVIA